jgi:transposase-like protein
MSKRVSYKYKFAGKDEERVEYWGNDSGYCPNCGSKGVYERKYDGEYSPEYFCPACCSEYVIDSIVTSPGNALFRIRAEVLKGE